MVARAGAGPDPIPHKQLTADRLADAIDFCLKPESLERAKSLANMIAAERGSDMGAQSFHQYLEADRLRCTLAPSRAAVWRIKRTQIRLSAFSACTLANANLLDFHELKLFRAQEYETDEGPWDPISGGFTTACRAFSNMGMGIAELPTETLKALHIPSGPSRRQSQASVKNTLGRSKTLDVRDRSVVPTPPGQIQTSSDGENPLSKIRSPSRVSSLSSRTSNIGSSSTSDADRSRFSNQDGYVPSKGQDMMRQSGAHTSKGIGRFAKALVQSPMELSVSITKGFHNAPKMWGDDTVRPQERIIDFKSGVKAVGKEFGYGWYDGVTGLVTQPWKGAQKEGAGGFLKGLGKGIGGFVAKPGAAMLGVLGHSMKGVHKEVQKLYGSNVQNYIVTSRVAQGYAEWLQSSDAEKEDVIVRWKLIQKYAKKKSDPDEMMRDILKEQQKSSLVNTQACSNPGIAGSESAISADVPLQDLESTIPSRSGQQDAYQPPNTGREQSLGEHEFNGGTRLLVQETSCGDAEVDSNVANVIRVNVSQLQRHRQGFTSHHSEDDEEILRQAMVSSEAEAQRHASEALEYEHQLKQAMSQSLMEQSKSSSNSAWASDMVLNTEENHFAAERGQAKSIAGKAAAAVAVASSGVSRAPSYDQGYLAGTTQREFDAQQNGKQGEKTSQERMEEDIVLEYIKKQSLLEVNHFNKGKGKGRATEEVEDDNLQEALKLSLQGHEYDVQDR